MSPSALFYSGVKKIATNVVRRAERFIRENPEISEAARRRLSKVTEARSLLISPVEQLCIRRPEKTIRDICRGLAREGLSPEIWKEASVEDKQVMVQKAASVISRECLLPRDVRSEIEVCFDSDLPVEVDSKTDGAPFPLNGKRIIKPLIYIDNSNFDNMDAKDVYGEVFQKIWNFDSEIISEPQSDVVFVESDKELFMDLYTTQTFETYTDPLVTYYQGKENIPEVFSNFAEGVSEKQKESAEIQMIKSSVAEIDKIIDGYILELENRGIQSSVAMLALEKHHELLLAELVRNVNGDFSLQVEPLTSADLDSIAKSCEINGLMNLNEPVPGPRALNETKYGFSKQIINGVEMKVYNDPIGTNSKLIQKQGESFYDMSGTCGLCQCANLLTMSGVPGFSEGRIITEVLHSSDEVLSAADITASENYYRGSSSSFSRQELLSQCGLETELLAIDYDRQKTVQQLAEKISSGHGVIVSVDAGRLWKNGQSGGHAISLISVSKDGKTFIYNDTGMGVMGTISAEELGKALTGMPANVTTNIIR